jgi:RNA polymerase sigma factor (sigma-70 family)
MLEEMSEPSPPSIAGLAEAREGFLTIVGGLRPELHRYCARLTGSVIEGEDIVQETLAKAFYALSLMPEAPPLRPWLFRIAHNAAMDFLKSHGRRFVEVREDLDALAFEVDEQPDPLVVRAALSRFLALPVAQRSAVILKDVLGHSLEETAETMGVTVPAVKGLLVRGRAGLREGAAGDDRAARQAADRARLDRYAALFNQRDWDGVRDLVAEDCRLDLVSKSTRRGKAVGAYFGRYEKEQDVHLRVLRLEGRDVLGVFAGDAPRPAYFILLAWDAEGRVSAIRDYRYAPYVAAEAEIDVG